MPEKDAVLAPEEDELYIGYLPSAPPRTAAFARRAVVAILLLAVVSAAVLAALQQPFSAAFYEFQIFRQFSGTLFDDPYPVLRVDRPDADDTSSHFYLVGQGKHGAGVGDLNERHVELEGSLIYRQDQTLLEVVPETLQADPSTVASPPAGEDSLGNMTLIGEIVDSKCYFGLMKPDSGKPHRACASLCIRGGIPPVFVVRDGKGPVAHLLLVDSAGGTVNERVLDRVAEPLEITGEVVRRGDLWLLRADPETYRRLSASQS